MNVNVHTFDKTRCLKNVESGRPDRADVEAAFRTIIRWTGDNPERSGLIETPARATRALEDFLTGYVQDPALILRKTFDEIEAMTKRSC